MTLNIQIICLFVSFLYGIFIYFILEILKKYIYNKRIFIKIIFSLFFSLFISIIYFILLLYVNNGILHVYFFMMIVVGYTLANFVYVKLFVKK